MLQRGCAGENAQSQRSGSGDLCYTGSAGKVSVLYSKQMTRRRKTTKLVFPIFLLLGAVVQWAAGL